jgi:hypothetical protein
LLLTVDKECLEAWPVRKWQARKHIVGAFLERAPAVAGISIGDAIIP